ncbi:MAG: WG repeat-containing protein, partial [Porphyromonadaceae bacterium]|nr:WG repeat-containing protein [Porphyromonadaceae bacterium]
MKRGSLVLLALLSVGLIEAQTLRPDVNKKGKYGYVDEAGKAVIPYKYAEAEPFENGLAKVRQGNKYGFIDVHGQPVGKMKYSLILPFTGDYCRVASGGSDKGGGLTGGKWGVLNTRGEEVIPPVYDEIGSFEQGFASVKKGKKYGLIDEKFRFLLEPKYSALGSFDEYGLCWFAAGGRMDSKTGKFVGGKYGVIDRSGKIILPAKYPVIGYFYSVLDEYKKVATYYNSVGSAQFNSVSLQRPGAPLLNRANAVAVSPDDFPNEEIVGTDSCYLFFGRSTSGLGLVDRKGKVLIPEGTFSKFFCPTDGMALFKNNGKKVPSDGYYNTETGRIISFSSEDNLGFFHDGRARIKDGSKGIYYFIDKEGKRVTYNDYAYAGNFDGGLAVVKSANKNMLAPFGFINAKGDILALRYTGIDDWSFHEGLLGVRSLQKKWGFIGTDGETVIPFEYDEVNSFRYGWAWVKKTGYKWGMIDKENQMVVPFLFEDVKPISEPNPRLVWVEYENSDKTDPEKKEKVWVCWDCAEGEMAFPFSVKDAMNFVEGMAYVQTSTNLYGAIDTKGNLLIPCTFDSWDTVMR